MNKFIKMLKDDSGAAAAEYALILAIVGSALAFAAFSLGNTISNSLNATGTRISSCSANAANCATPAP